MDINPDTEAAVRLRHPWLTFHVDLGNMAPKFWMLLGEARSKADHLSMVPVPKAYADTLHRVELAKGVHATTAIEGNTLTASQVLERMEGQLQVEPSQEYQVREVDNVLAAYNGILADILAGTPPSLSSEAICQFNRTILDGLPREGHVTPGEIRTDPVTVGSGIYTPPNAAHCRYLLDRLCDWLNGPSFEQHGDMRIPVALIKASLAHLYLAWIHPFGDGNGRTARCIEFLVLITSGVPTSAAHLISNHCNQTRSEYYRELRVASASGGDVSSFLSYCLQGFVGGMTEQLKMVYGHQFELAWSEVVRQRGPRPRSRDGDEKTSAGGTAATRWTSRSARRTSSTSTLRSRAPTRAVEQRRLLETSTSS